MKISREAKIGIMALVTIAIFYWGFNFLKGKNIFKRTNTFYAIYDNLSGLKESGSILVNGFKVGQLNGIYILQDSTKKLLVRFLVDKNVNISKGSIAQLANDDIMGTKVINLLIENSPELHKDGDTLKTEIDLGLLDAIGPLKSKVENLANKMDSTLLAINNILDVETQRKIRTAIDNIEGMASNLNRTFSQNGNIATILNNIEALTYKIDNVFEKLILITTDLASVSDSLKGSEIKSTINNANKSLAQIDTILTKINEGKGSLGLLVNNDTLYNNLSNASENLELLLEDLKENPNRYVHISVFGKKEKSD